MDTNEIVKKLTGKNPAEYELAAAHIINDCDLDAFRALVDKSDFLFEFIKENVKKRFSNVINNQNYKNLIKFLKIYDYSYEDFIVLTLVKYADEDLTDEMLEKLENGTDEEKAYCAKYFSYINDSLALELLRVNSHSEFEPLSMNCAEALCAFGDKEAFGEALKELNSEDEMEKLSAVKFLTAFKENSSLDPIFEAMKKSSMSEYIAAEVPYIKSFFWLFEHNYKDEALLTVNNILNGFGDIISLSQVFDFEFYDFFSRLIEEQTKTQFQNSKIALVLLKANEKFLSLTENDEYIFDESKEVKNEINEIKKLLTSQGQNFWDVQKKYFLREFDENSDFVFSALDLAQELNYQDSFENIKGLLTSSNQTIILKAVEVIKGFGKIGEISEHEVFSKVTDDNIKLILQSLF